MYSLSLSPRDRPCIARSPEPNASLLVDKPHTILRSSSACPISLILRALGHGADVGDVKEGAVSTIEAVEEAALAKVLKELKDFLTFGEASTHLRE